MAVRLTVAVGDTTTFYTARAVSKRKPSRNKFGEHYARELVEQIRHCEPGMKIYFAAFRPSLSRVTTPSPTEN